MENETTPAEVDPLSAFNNDNGDESEDEDAPCNEEDKPDVDDTEEDTKKDFDEDLFITVSDPEKHIHTMETFISYQVATKTTRSTFDSSEFTVRRRYQDFVWLREKLEEDHPTFIIPPLPSKFVMKGMLDRFNTVFIETRCHALHKFLDRISKHPVVSFNEHLKIFLTSEEFSAVKKQGFMSRMTGSLKWSRVNNDEFEDVLQTATLFGDKMSVMDRISERLLLEKKELVSELKEFSPTFTAWGNFEEGVTETIMASMSSCLETCTSDAEENSKKHEERFIPPLKEYILHAEVVKNVLKRRDIFQSQFEKCDEELRQKREEKENLPKSDQSYSIGAMMGKSPELVKEQKTEKLTQQIEELSTQREKLSDDLERANTNFRADMERWNNLKTKDLASVFSNFADSQIDYHNGCLAAWENILPTMQEALALDSPAENAT